MKNKTCVFLLIFLLSDRVLSFESSDCGSSSFDKNKAFDIMESFVEQNDTKKYFQSKREMWDLKRHRCHYLMRTKKPLDSFYSYIEFVFSPDGVVVRYANFNNSAGCPVAEKYRKTFTIKELLEKVDEARKKFGDLPGMLDGGRGHVSEIDCHIDYVDIKRLNGKTRAVVYRFDVLGNFYEFMEYDSGKEVRHLFDMKLEEEWGGGREEKVLRSK